VSPLLLDWEDTCVDARIPAGPSQLRASTHLVARADEVLAPSINMLPNKDFLE
jgi:hypothetical protein